MSNVYLLYKKRLEDVFSEHAPAKVSKIPTLLKKYEGREHQLYAKACQKYGVSEEPEFTAGGGGERSVQDVYRQRLTQLYKSHDSGKLHKISKHLEKYQGNEHSIYLKLCKRYGFTPEPEYTGSGPTRPVISARQSRRLSESSNRRESRRRSSLINKSNMDQWSSADMNSSRRQMEDQLALLREGSSDEEETPMQPSRRRTLTDQDGSSSRPMPKGQFEEWRTSELGDVAGQMKDELAKMDRGGHVRGMSAIDTGGPFHVRGLSAMKGELDDIAAAGEFLTTLDRQKTPTAAAKIRRKASSPAAIPEEGESSENQTDGDADDQEGMEELIYHFESKLMAQLKKIQKHLDKDKKWKQMPSPIQTTVKQHILSWKNLQMQSAHKIEMLSEGKAEQAQMYEELQQKLFLGQRELERLQQEQVGSAANNVQLQMLQAEFEKAKARLEEAEEEIDEAESKEEALKTKVNELKDQLEKLAEGDDAVAELTADLEEANAARARLKKALEDAQDNQEQEQHDWDEEKGELDDMIEKLQQANQQFTFQHQSTQNDAKGLQDQLVQIATEKADFQERLEEANEELSRLRPRIAKNEKESELLRAQISKLEIQGAAAGSAKAEVARLKGELKLAEHKLDAAASGVQSGADTRLVELSARIRQLEQRKVELEDQLSESRRRAEDAALRTGTLEGELKGAQRELDALRGNQEQQREMFEESKRVHQDHREDMQRQVAMANDRVNEFQAKNEKLKADRESLRSEVESLKAMQSGDGNAARKQVERLQAQLESANQRSADLTNSLDEQRALVEDLKQASQQGRQDQQGTIQMLREQIEQLKASSERSESSSRERFKHIEEVQESLTKARAESEHMLVRVRKAEGDAAEKDKAIRELSERAGEVKGLRNQLRDKAALLEGQVDQQNQKDAIMRTIHQTLDEQRNSIARLERQNQELEERGPKKQAGVGGGEQYREMLRNRDSRVEELNQDLAHMAAEMEQLRTSSRTAQDERDKVSDDLENAIGSKMRLIFDTSDEIERLKHIITRQVIIQMDLHKARGSASSNLEKEVDDWAAGSDDIVYGGL